MHRSLNSPINFTHYVLYFRPDYSASSAMPEVMPEKEIVGDIIDAELYE